MASRALMKHDRFFRAAMSRKPVYRAFFDRHLPPRVKDLVALDEIKPTKGSFVDRSLRSHLTDMVFKAPIAGNDGYIYVLVEHQSTQERLMPFRIQKYVLEIMDHHVKSNKTDKLPLVYPMVFYNGKPSYTQPKDLFDLFDVDRDIASSVMSGPLRVIDVGAIPDEQLKGQVWLTVLHLLMKHITANDITMVLLDLVPFLKQIEGERDGREFIVESIIYMLSAGQAEDANKIIEIAEQSFAKEIGEEVMTVAEMLENNAKQAVAVELLKEGLSIEFIARVTKLSEETIKTLKDDLDRKDSAS